MNSAGRFSVSLVLALAAGSAAAQYPTKPITIVSPFAQGGTSDFVGRIVAHRIEENNPGWRFIIDTRPGADGQIGTNFVAKAAPDGYTLLLGPSSTNAIQPSVFKKLPYDVLRDFAGITMLGATANIIAVNPAVPAHNVKELIAYAKANPGKLNFSSPGTGTSGSAHERVIEVTAIGRSRPAFTFGTAAEIFSTSTCTSPPSTAVIEGPLPLNGTCSMSMPAASLNISPEIWTEVPVPGDEKLSLPGLALA